MLTLELSGGVLASPLPDPDPRPAPIPDPAAVALPQPKPDYGKEKCKTTYETSYKEHIS